MRRQALHVASALLPLALLVVFALGALGLSIATLAPRTSAWASGTVVVIAGGTLAYWVVRTLERLGRFLSAAAHERAALQRALEDWVAGISHDLKTPLSAIRGYAELLAAGDWPAEEVQRQASAVLERCNGLEKLIEELDLPLQGSGAPEFKRRPVDLASVIRDVVAEQNADPVYPEADVAWDDGGVQAIVLGDRGLLKRAVANAVRNAVVHNPIETTVTVSIAVDGRRVAVVVNDNGRGMDPKVLEAVLGRGDAGEARTEGASGDARGGKATHGLGMSIARSLIEAHGGLFEVESKQGKGTAVTLSLPLAVEPRDGFAEDTPGFSGVDGLAAVRVEDLTGDVAAPALRCQEEVRRRDLPWLSRPAHR